MTYKNKLSQWAHTLGTQFVILLCTGVLFATACPPKTEGGPKTEGEAPTAAAAPAAPAEAFAIKIKEGEGNSENLVPLTPSRFIGLLNDTPESLTGTNLKKIFEKIVFEGAAQTIFGLAKVQTRNLSDSALDNVDVASAVLWALQWLETPSLKDTIINKLKAALKKHEDGGGVSPKELVDAGLKKDKQSGQFKNAMNEQLVKNCKLDKETRKSFKAFLLKLDPAAKISAAEQA